MAADGQPTMSAASAASAPSYPSSNKKQVDWDKVDKEVSEELEGEKLEGDAALNKLFQDIYGRADEVRTRPSVALGAHSDGSRNRAGHATGNEQVDANERRHGAQHELGRSE